MESKKEIFAEILKLVQQKYTQVLEIDKLTSELAEALSRDDRESALLLLDMRQNEMDEASETERGIRTVLEVIDTDMRMELKLLLEGDLRAEAEDFESGKILELGETIRKTLAHTISIDKVVSQKLAGKDSYYAMKE